MTDLDWSLSKASRRRKQERDKAILSYMKDAVFILAVFVAAMLSLGAAG